MPSEKRSSWLLPLREICELADGKLEEAERIMEGAYRRLRQDGLTISSPRSILKTARAVAAEGASEHGREASRDWDRRVFGASGLDE